jgi:hypothetical protein
MSPFPIIKRGEAPYLAVSAPEDLTTQCCHHTPLIKQIRRGSKRGKHQNIN